MTPPVTKPTLLPEPTDERAGRHLSSDSTN
jgi:hypothetical protein